MHLAELNIGRLVAPQGDPRVADFFDALDRINKLADTSPGFVWRLVDGESDNAVSLRPDGWDDDMLINLSVWESREALFDYVYRSEHLEFMRRRREWFLPLGVPPVALWWIPVGHIPTLGEAVEHLEHLREHGPTPYAFTFRNAFEPERAASACPGHS
ncbi:DUF3291 domain-containing protein [Nocardia sp. NPDC127526]|uniref:DUF3291 domain-containing protein n=1 Tax=Nocardia sp. NPDC127526 TaxID=3345393 RepID=UPI003625ACD9